MSRARPPDEVEEDEEAGPALNGGLHASPRMLSYSDALLSIIATVMILPVAHTKIYPDQFDKNIQKLLATKIAVYLMTFLIVTVAWAAHIRLFQVIGQIDDTLALLNLACMMIITFLPYTFSLMASFPDVPLGIFLFCSCVVTMGVIQAVIVVYGFHYPHLLNHQIWRSENNLKHLYKQHILKIILRGPAFCFLAAIFSFFFYPMSYLLLGLVIFLPYIHKLTMWCKDKIIGPKEEERRPSLDFFTFNIHEPLSKERVEAFSDGVYAIVATLLILDICPALTLAPWTSYFCYSHRRSMILTVGNREGRSGHSNRAAGRPGRGISVSMQAGPRTTRDLILPPPLVCRLTLGASSNWTTLPPPLFRKVVIVLIDALRDDFVFGAKGARFMPYTNHLVERGSSHSFVAEAKPPTVTMPRIKALMTGSIPGFIDIVMNLNSPALLEDNLIWQAKAAGKRIIFYGDETWIKLFPKHFVEYDGTTSFFVSDFTEVDDNVTRHLDKVLKREDWDLLILHYLGLDHIGHLTGPNSPLVGPKLSEMDNILKKIHTSLLAKESEASLANLLVLCGDHGMSDTGSHGGSSAEEVQTPLVFISSDFESKSHNKHHKLVQQTDLAATLAVGLGLPISRNSVGNLILPIMERKTIREQLRVLHLNAVQLSKLLQENVASYEKDLGFEQFKIAEKSHGNWIKLYLEGNNSEVLLNLGRKVLKQYIDALRTLSSSLSKQVAQYDMYSMLVGTVIVLEVLLLLLLSIPKALCSSAEFEVPLSSPLFSLLFYLLFLVLSAVHVIVCTSDESLCYFCSISWLMALGVMMLISALFCGILSALGKAFVTVRLPTKNPAASSSSWSELDLLILIGTIGHVLSLGASSFIEEEHQTWYFLVNTLCLALCQEICRNYSLGKETDLRLHSPGKLGSGYSEELHKSDWTDELENDKKKDRASGDLFEGYEKWMGLASPWIILICCRLLRSLNQTGVQWAHRLDFGHWLTSSDHKTELSVLAAISLVMIFILVQRRCSLVSKIAMALGLLGVYSYRAAIGNVVFPWQQDSKDISKGIIEARFVYVFVLGILFTGTKALLQSQVIPTDFNIKSLGLWEIYCGLVLLASLLFRPHNLPVLVFCLLIQTLMTKFIWKPLRLSTAQITIMHYWFGQAFFYFQGNSNNIATVDISAGFVGLNSYIEMPAIFLTGFATYAGPVLWAVHLLCYLSSEINRSSAMSHGCFCYALICSIPVSAYIILVTTLRYHLFIWSVFSPKLLYEGVHLFITAAICVFFTAVDPKQSHKIQD
ncbi:endosomal/lysosomal potassium channel TMEM175 isoform X2 [Ornithorhynchus anatinus]|uniref:endosomal/lysosomal potassium channel TMEM175 isoform X2 n=1 Tax=Ornithorhynchus anatinus TaxID=9258 RepID=UPI0010A81FCC|nr:endosomal/lysosomal potassium channel TMEM175 isoform X2 [Ornithorhynchus anatinus]